jgi:VWFA-related protein
MIPARTSAGAAFLLLLGTPLVAQPPLFRSGVELVTIDTRVLDSDGRPLVGLGRDDFALTVDGQPRAIESVTFVEAPAAAAAGPGPDVSANDAGPDGQIVLLVVDRTNIRQGDGHQGIQGLTTLVERLSPADRVGLYTFPDGGPVVDLTSDRRTVLAALSRVRGIDARQQSPFVTTTLSEALRIAAGDRPTLDEVVGRNCMALINTESPEQANRPIEVCRQQVRREAQTLVQDARHRNEHLLRRLELLLESLRFVEGRKVLVFVSEGLAFDGQLQGRLRTFSSAVASLSTAFYAVQTFGSQTDLAGRGPSPDWDEDRHLRAEGLSLVAGMSGGALFRPGPRPQGAFERIGRELSARYVVAFRVDAGERDGQSHTIGLTLRPARKASLVRHRTQFTVGPAAGEPRLPETLAAALSAPLPVPTLPLRVGVFSVPDGPIGAAQVKVLLGAEIGRSGEAPTGARTAFEVFDADGRRVAHTETPIQAAAMPLRYTTALRLSPGRYRLKFAARDATGRIGSVEHPFDAGEAAASLDFSVSSLLLFADRADGDASPALAFDLPASRPAFSALLVSRSTGADGWADVSAALEIADAHGFTRHHRPMAMDAGSAPAERSFTADVSADRWEPGDYVAHATLTRQGRTLAKLSRSFRILEEPAGADAAATTAAPAPPETLVDASLLRRATDYVLHQTDRSSAVVAEERYVQAVVDAPGGEPPADLNDLIAWREDHSRPRAAGAGAVERRQLRSDLLMVRTASGWYTNYRDVAEVDGRRVKERAVRALALFTSGGDPAGAGLRKVAEESARYNLGNLRRTINTPTLPLFALHPAHVARFTFEGVGRELVDGLETTVVRFRERLAPTFIVTERGDYVFTAGRLWLADNGRVVKTSLLIEGRDSGMRAAIDVVYRDVPSLGLLMPVEMRERYSNLPGDRGRVIAGRATYTNFRTFSVTTNEQLR